MQDTLVACDSVKELPAMMLALPWAYSFAACAP
jgi:hypothetical protein